MNLGKTILEYVGGESNVKTLVHCATRLRFTLYDESIAKAKEIENLDDVISVMRSGGQFQVVVGTNVKYIYKEAVEGTNLSISKVNEEVGEKKNILSRLLETLSGLFTPLLPLLAGSGLLSNVI